MTKLSVEASAVRELYSETGKTGRKLMEQIFGSEVFKERPVGIWCLSVDGNRFKAEEWTCEESPYAVLVVTEETAFVVGLHASVALQWGSPEIKEGLITDKESLDSKAATDAIIRTHENSHYKDKDGRIWDVKGAPAAEWCRKYSAGDDREWDLPTIAQLLIMHKNRDEINDCIEAMGGYKLTPGWYWSSIAKEDNPQNAWFVFMGHGGVGCNAKHWGGGVRAVSAFQL